jgi:hypothetical protein
MTTQLTSPGPRTHTSPDDIEKGDNPVMPLNSPVIDEEDPEN